MKYLFTILLIFLVSIHSSSQEITEKNIGDKVPNFSAKDDQGKNWNSDKLQTEYLVVYFYPAAMTGGCTKQACAYRDDKSTFDKLNVTVIGVSGDEVKNLQFFKEAYDLNFPLLSDTKGVIAKSLGVPTNKGGTISREINGLNQELIRNLTTPRWTFILDKNHTIIYKNAKVNAVDDSQEVIDIIKSHSK